MSTVYGPPAQRPHRLSRRGSIGAATACAATLAIAGCGGRTTAGRAGGAATSGGPQATPKRGGTIILSTNFQRGLDPHILQATQTGMFGMFYSLLVRANQKTYELEPDLATKWEVPSPTELVFTLAPNIKWHDRPPANGRPLKVEDIIFSYNRVQTKDPKFINKNYLNSIDKMEAVDARTLKLTLRQPDVTQLGNLSAPGLKVLAPEVVEAARGNLAEASTTVGTGAFILQSTETNVGSELIRNPNYFKPGLPYVDEIKLRAFQDAQSEWSAFLAGKIDHRWVPGEDSQTFARDKSGQYQLDWFGDLDFYIAQAMTLKKPFDDARVTGALRLLIDHDEFQKAWGQVWWGRARHSLCYGAGTADNWDLTEDEYKQHLEWKQPKDEAIKTALSLLAAAGFSKDKPLKFVLSGTGEASVPFQQAASQLLQAQFRRNGAGVVDPEIKLYPSAAWDAVRSNSDFEYYVGGHATGGEDPDNSLSGTYKTGGGRNYGKMSDPQLDQMIAKQRTIFDENERKKAIGEITLYMIDHVPYGCLVSRYVLNATQLNVENFPTEGVTTNWGDHYETAWVQ
ncbi:MAG TPA: ABC transporter substrate-binding protein [Dehalococcoidia bacterium]|nr:ABC transporter substrate-binding protein [Dehalococcoidia bacterium]